MRKTQAAKVPPARAYAPGTRVLVDGLWPATVKAAFPEGSTSMMYAHYKLDFEHGDRNVAVAADRVRCA